MMTEDDDDDDDHDDEADKQQYGDEHRIFGVSLRRSPADCLTGWLVVRSAGCQQGLPLEN